MNNKQSIVRRLIIWADQPGGQPPAGLKQILHTLVRIVLITAREFNRNELSLRASALTYTFLLFLVPMLAMSTALVKGLGGNYQLRQAMHSYIDSLQQNTAPAGPAAFELDGTQQAEAGTTEEITATLTVHLRSAADKIFDYVDKTDFTTLGSIGVVIMLITVILAFDTIEQAMNTIWKAPTGRTAVRKVTDYLALLILIPIAINVSFAATTIIKNPALFARIEPFLPVIWLQTFFLLLLPVLFITFALTVSYIVFPNTKVHTIPAFIGAIFAASLWFITQNIYISLQIGVSRYNAIYGSFATLPLFLIWLHLGLIFILTGSQVAYACQTRHSYQLIEPQVTPAQKLSAAFDIIRQLFLAFDRQQTITAKMLPDLCPGQRPALLFSTAERLLAAGIIHTKDQEEYLFPTLPAAKLNQGAIVKAILGSDTPETEGGRQSRLAIEAASQALPLTFEESQNS